MRLRFSLNQAPVDRRDLVAFGNGQAALERAAVAARHVFGAENRAVVNLQLLDAPLETFRGVVVVERDDVGEVKLRDDDEIAGRRSA